MMILVNEISNRTDNYESFINDNNDNYVNDIGDTSDTSDINVSVILVLSMIVVIVVIIVVSRILNYNSDYDNDDHSYYSLWRAAKLFSSFLFSHRPVDFFYLFSFLSSPFFVSFMILICIIIELLAC